MRFPDPKSWLWLAVGIAAAASLVLLVIQLASRRTYHYIEVDQGKLYRDGLKTTGQFLASCQRGQIRTIVSLVGNDEIGNARFGPAMTACAGRGIQLKHVPVHISSWPTSADVQAFLAIATDPASQPVIVHCREGIRRTGMMTAAYQMSILGYTPQQAKSAIQAFGHSDRTISDLIAFIDNYDPLTRTFLRPQSPPPAAGESAGE